MFSLLAGADGTAEGADSFVNDDRVFVCDARIDNRDELGSDFFGLRASCITRRTSSRLARRRSEDRRDARQARAPILHWNEQRRRVSPLAPRDSRDGTAL